MAGLWGTLLVNWLVRRSYKCIVVLCLFLTAMSLLATLDMDTLRAITPAPPHSSVWLEEIRSGEEASWGGLGWLWGDGGQATCTPTTNIAFLKTHKCASSAIQNILLRYSYNEGLHVAVPDYGNYYGGGTLPFKAPMYHVSPWAKLGVNIFAVHTKWSQDEIAKIMPNDTIYLTIVREPAQLFESLFTFTGMEKNYKMNAEQFAVQIPASAPRLRGFLGYNQMAWDFGMPAKDINNLTAVAQMVERASRAFDLVLVAERMEESLVLLAHFLCWPLEDVLVLKINARENKYKARMNESSVSVLREKLAPDYLIYNHFLARLDALVVDFGRRRMAREVERLRRLTKKLMEECGFDKTSSKNMKGVNKPWSNMVVGYTSNITNSNCTLYPVSEHSLLTMLRNRQRQEVIRRFGLRQTANLPAGAIALGGPSGMTPQEAVEALKKTIVHSNKEPLQKPVILPPQKPGLPPQKPGILPQKPGLLPQKPRLPPQKPRLPPQKPRLPPQKTRLPPQKPRLPPQKPGPSSLKSGELPLKQIVPPQKPKTSPHKPGVSLKNPGKSPLKPKIPPRKPGLPPQKPETPAQKQENTITGVRSTSEETRTIARITRNTATKTRNR